MLQPVRIFVSHSSDDAVLAATVASRLQQRPKLQVLIDQSGLEPGKPWRRDLHEWMARCGAGLVLLTPAVLARPQWVLKEAIILGWRLDLERDFRLFFALAPGVNLEVFNAAGFALAQLAETQLLKARADPEDVDALVDEIASLLPDQQPPTPFDELIETLASMLRAADPVGTTYPMVAKHLGIATPANWGPDKLAQLADEIARAIVRGRDTQLAIDKLVNVLKPWDKDQRRKLTQMLVPYWVDAQAAGRLLRNVRATPVAPSEDPIAMPAALLVPAPREPVDEASQPTPGAVVIAGDLVPEFTAEMYVRRAFGMRQDAYRLAGAVALEGGDMYAEIRRELCQQARAERWALPSLKNDDAVVQKLKTSAWPIFVPLVTLPDAATLQRLHNDFPRVLFVAPRPEGGLPGVSELLPAPSKLLEAAEHKGWDGAMNAIRNL